MKQLNVIDEGFLIAESREMPMHVGCVSLYDLPAGVNEQEFLHELAANLRDAEALVPPFGDHLHTGRMGLAGATFWEPDPALDLEYHVRHSALPKPGRYRELFTLVSRLHGTLLERSRPLWEMHLIEGLQNRQFAVYTKAHHAAVDGARSVHVMRSMLSADPDYRLEDSPLSLRAWEEYKASIKMGKRPDYTASEMRAVTDIIKQTFDSSSNIYQAVKGFAQAWSGRGSGLKFPHLDVPTSSLNTKISGSRRFVAQSWPFERIKAVGAALDGTFNDAVLAMCAGALRLHFQSQGEIPTDSLKAMVPMSLRQAGDVDSGNAVASISADLATHVEDPIVRFRAIQQSVQAGKEYYRLMTPSEIELFTLIMQTPSLVLMPAGLIDRYPPYNLVISNVPGIRQPMYWNGARLTGNYPLSIITDGMALNITLVTYAQNVDFGIIACRRSVPQVQRLIDYMEESLQELEDVAGIKAKPAKRKAAAKKPAAKRPAAKKAKAKPKAKAAAKPKAKTKAKAKPKAKAKARPKVKAKRKATPKVKPKLAAG